VCWSEGSQILIVGGTMGHLRQPHDEPERKRETGGEDEESMRRTDGDYWKERSPHGFLAKVHNLSGIGG
jgi:hypothetical protein